MRYPTKYDVFSIEKRREVFTIHWRKYPSGEYNVHTFTDPKDKLAYRLFERYYMGEIANIELRLE